MIEKCSSLAVSVSSSFNTKPIRWQEEWKNCVHVLLVHLLKIKGNLMALARSGSRSDHTFTYRQVPSNVDFIAFASSAQMFLPIHGA